MSETNNEFKSNFEKQYQNPALTPNFAIEERDMEKKEAKRELLGNSYFNKLQSTMSNTIAYKNLPQEKKNKFNLELASKFSY
jgi:hypothetical protein